MSQSYPPQFPHGQQPPRQPAPPPFPGAPRHGGPPPPQPGPLQGGSPPQAGPPPAKKRGGVRKVIGTLLVLVAVLPLLGSGFMVYKAFDNAQQWILNDEFVPEAWHNLPADQFFPDTFGDFEYRHPETDEATPVYSWARQGIDGTASCDDDPGLVPGFVKLVSQYGCRSVVRATYVDTTGTWVATLAVVVLGSPQDAKQVLAEVEAKDPAQLVHAMPVPATPAADWSEEDRAGVALDTMFLNEDDQPYLVAVTLGYADGREVDELPDPWWGTAGADNERMLDIPASRMAGQFTQQLHKTITGPANSR